MDNFFVCPPAATVCLCIFSGIYVQDFLQNSVLQTAIHKQSTGQYYGLNMLLKKHAL